MNTDERPMVPESEDSEPIEKAMSDWVIEPLIRCPSCASEQVQRGITHAEPGSHLLVEYRCRFCNTVMNVKFLPVSTELSNAKWIGP